MTASSDLAVLAILEALRTPSPETRVDAHAHLAPAVEIAGPFGGGSGTTAFDALLDHPLVSRLLGGADWSEPERDDQNVTLIATAPPGAAVGGFQFVLHLDADERIDRVEQDLLPAPPLEPEPVVLTDAHITLLADALANGTPMIVAYVDASGAPQISYRATVQALGTDRLGMWIRDPAGGLVRALATNPHLSCFYSDRAHGVTLQFHGRGHVDDTDAIRDAVYDGSPLPERNMDWRKRGVAVVVELDKVDGRDSSGRVLMARPAD